MTRAKDFLYVTWPLRYFRRQFSDAHRYAQASRFLTDEVKETMESVALECVDDDDWDFDDDEGPPDIGGKIRSRWD